MKLFVENVTQAWKWISMQMMVLAIAFQSAWEVAPEALKNSFTPTQVYYITLSLLVIGVIGRVVKQPLNAAK